MSACKALIGDSARAKLLVLEDSRTDSRLCNVGGDRWVSVLAHGHLVARRAGIEIAPEVPGLYGFGDTRHVISDVGKLKALGWRPLVPMEEIVHEYLEWAQGQPGLRDYYAEAEARMQALGTLRKVAGL